MLLSLKMPFGLPRWFRGKESVQSPVWKITWRRAWQPTLVFLLENPMDRGAWRATVHKVAESEVVVELCLSLCDPVDCSTPGFLFLTISQSLPKFTFMPSSHRILWHLLLLLPSIFPSARDFSNELSVCIRWPKYWSFSFSISKS